MENILYTLNLNLDDETGTDCISLVEHPAIEINFLTFSKNEVQLKVQDEDKQIVTGVIAIPDKLIPREGNTSVKFEKDKIEKDAIKFFKRNATKNVNLEHQEKVSDVYVFESWLTGEKDKSHDMFGVLPIGSWCVSMKVDNPDVWKLVKEGKVKGFSLEGFFEWEKVEDQKPEEEDIKLNKIKELLNSYFHK